MIGLYVLLGFTIVSWLLLLARIDGLKADLAREMAWSETLLRQRDAAVNRIRELRKDGAT